MEVVLREVAAAEEVVVVVKEQALPLALHANQQEGRLILRAQESIPDLALVVVADEEEVVGVLPAAQLVPVL